MAEKIGSLVHIRRFPVKSMAGEMLQTAAVKYTGVSGDRVYAFQDQAKRNNFPWLTARQMPTLFQYHPTWSNPLEVEVQYPAKEDFDLHITTPDGIVYNIQEEALLTELESLSQRPLTLRFSEASMHDARPISIISQQTILALEKELDLPLDHRRFRMNFEVNWDNNIPYFEDELVGKKLQIGSTLVLEISKRNQRCVMTNIDPDTAEVNDSIFKHLAEKHEACLGIYGIVVKEGIVKAGDEVTML